jgi:uncharacterized protein
MTVMDLVWGFIGGLMVGGAAAMYLLINGRIMGASGIVGMLVDGTARDTAKEKLAFLAGLIGVPALLSLVFTDVKTNLTPNWGIIIIAGLLVGLGTRLANGCTSGHGICGMSRLSLRGIVATVFYILAGGLVMAVLRHVLEVL